jgi:prefoldin subunit 5
MDFEELIEYEKTQSAVEVIGDEILQIRKNLVEFDRKRNQNREAIRFLLQDEGKKDRWVLVGSNFISLPKGTAKEVLQEEIEEIGKEIEKWNKILKEKMNEMARLEGSVSQAKDFELIGMKPGALLSMAEREPLVRDVL